MHSWKYIAYANDTILLVYPGARMCQINPSSSSRTQLLSAWYPSNWTAAFGYEKLKIINGITCRAFYEFHDVSLSAAESTEYAVSFDGVPISIIGGLGDGPYPPGLPLLQADVFHFDPEVQASEDHYRWPSYCPNVDSFSVSHGAAHADVL